MANSIRRKHLQTLLLSCLCIICNEISAAIAAPVLLNNNNINNSSYELLDMSYSFDNDTIYWPTSDVAGGRFNLEVVAHGIITFNNHTVYNEQNTFAAREHGGTHIDAPAHFVENAKHVADIPLEHLMGPAVKIDIRKQVQKSLDNHIDYLMTPDDIFHWEKKHGKIRNGSLVFVYTGYGKFWPDRMKYFGFDGTNETDLHFPAVTEEAAQVLADRGAKAVGIDTASPDNMRNIPLVHVLLLGADVIIIENVANLDRLPVTGANVYGLPMKIGNGSGAPVRLFAQIPV